MAQRSSNSIGTFFKKDIRDAVISAGNARFPLKQDTSNDIRRKSNGIQAGYSLVRATAPVCPVRLLSVTGVSGYKNPQISKSGQIFAVFRLDYRFS